jgi:hypothetical protein
MSAMAAASEITVETFERPLAAVRRVLNGADERAGRSSSCSVADRAAETRQISHRLLRSVRANIRSR